MGSKFDALTERLLDVRNLDRASAVLNWDMETQMPPGGANARARQLATLARIQHQMFTSDETARLLQDAAAEVQGTDYDSVEASTIRVAQQDFDDATKQPTDFVARLTELTAHAHHVWAEARARNDFGLFRDSLAQIVEMVQQQAEYLGYTDHPYDALVNQYERGITTAQIRDIFNGHKPQLIQLIADITAVKERVDDAVLHQDFPEDRQREFGQMVAAAFGYSFERGRLDKSVHPFSTSFSRDDSRITTRYHADWLSPALFGIMHEAGHSMYEQGVDPALDTSVLGNGTSLGVHESQSRMWENLVGRSRGFWQWAFPKLRDAFPDQLRGVDAEGFYRAINRVSPSFIRVEADEATYNLHIMLRFEIEQDLVSGALKAADVPAAWNAKFNENFGITPPDDAHGCLQDIHWSFGGLGYFPTYALGNLLSVQYYNRAVQDRPTIPDDIASGNFDTLRTWLNDNIHRHGRKYTSDELTRRVTGEGIQSRSYITYLNDKFRDVYGL